MILLHFSLIARILSAYLVCSLILDEVQKKALMEFQFSVCVCVCDAPNEQGKARIGPPLGEFIAFIRSSKDL